MFLLRILQRRKGGRCRRALHQPDEMIHASPVSLFSRQIVGVGVRDVRAARV